MNATTICKPNDTRWKDHGESHRCQHYLDALVESGSDGWPLESVQQASLAPLKTALPRLREAEVIALVERRIGLLEMLGGLDQRAQLLFEDIILSNVLTLNDAWLIDTSKRFRARLVGG